MNPLRIDIWSDIACPWCYVGKRRLEAALEQFSHREQVEVVWRAFELDPGAPRERDRSQTYAQRLAGKYGCSEQQAVSMMDRMAGVARADGLDFRFDLIRPGNTFDAHRLLHLARELGKQDAVKERFLLGYLTEGAPIGELETLERLGVEAGLEASAVREVLRGEAYQAQVREDEALASSLGIHGVPFFVLGGKFAVSGAQPIAVVASALARAWQATCSLDWPEGPVCGPDGCR